MNTGNTPALCLHKAGVFTECARCETEMQGAKPYFFQKMLHRVDIFEYTAWVNAYRCSKMIFFGYTDVTPLLPSPDLQPDHLYGADGHQ